MSVLMAVVLLTWELGAGTGHCVKLASVARRLAATGHKLALAARDLTTASRFFESIPIEYLQAPFLVDRPHSPILWPRSLAQILQNIGFGDERYLDVLVRAWRNLFAAVQPAVIVADHSPTALLAARWCGARRVALGTGFEIPPACKPLPDIEYWRADKLDPSGMLAQEQAVLDAVNTLLDRNGLPPMSQLSELYSDVDLSFLLTCSRSRARSVAQHGRRRT